MERAEGVETKILILQIVETTRNRDNLEELTQEMKEVNTPRTGLYEAVRNEESTFRLMPLLEWHRDNLNRDEALEYTGVEHAYETLMSRTDDQKTKSRLETLRID